MTLGYQNELVSSWFDRRHADARNSFDPFIYLWISLNAALSARYGRRGDKEKVELFAREIAEFWAGWLASDDELREAVTALAAASPIYDEPPFPDGRQGFAEVAVDDAESAMLGVYAIRNNLFHGSKAFDVQRDHRLVTVATTVVERALELSGLLKIATQRGDLTGPLD